MNRIQLVSTKNAALHQAGNFQPISLKENDPSLQQIINLINEKNPYQSDQEPNHTKIFFDPNVQLPLEEIEKKFKAFLSQKNPEELLKKILDEGVAFSNKGLVGHSTAKWNWKSTIPALGRLLLPTGNRNFLEEGKKAVPFKVAVHEGAWMGLGLIPHLSEDPIAKYKVFYFDKSFSTNDQTIIEKELKQISIGNSLLCRVSDGTFTDGFFFTRNKEGKLISICTTGALFKHQNLYNALSKLNAENPVVSDCLPLNHDGNCTAWTEIATYFIIKAAEIRGTFLSEIIIGLHDKSITIDSINTIDLPQWAIESNIENRTTVMRLLKELKSNLEASIKTLYKEENAQTIAWKKIFDKLPFDNSLFTKSSPPNKIITNFLPFLRNSPRLEIKFENNPFSIPLADLKEVPTAFHLDAFLKDKKKLRLYIWIEKSHSEEQKFYYHLGHLNLIYQLFSKNSSRSFENREITTPISVNGTPIIIKRAGGSFSNRTFSPIYSSHGEANEKRAYFSSFANMEQNTFAEKEMLRLAISLVNASTEKKPFLKKYRERLALPNIVKKRDFKEDLLGVVKGKSIIEHCYMLYAKQAVLGPSILKTLKISAEKVALSFENLLLLFISNVSPEDIKPENIGVAEGFFLIDFGISQKIDKNPHKGVSSLFAEKEKIGGSTLQWFPGNEEFSPARSSLYSFCLSFLYPDSSHDFSSQISSLQQKLETNQSIEAEKNALIRIAKKNFTSYWEQEAENQMLFDVMQTIALEGWNYSHNRRAKKQPMRTSLMIRQLGNILKKVDPSLINEAIDALVSRKILIIEEKEKPNIKFLIKEGQKDAAEKELQPKISATIVEKKLKNEPALKGNSGEMIERLYLLSKPYLFPEESPMRDMKQGEPKDLWISEMIDLSEKNFKTFWEPDAKPLFEAMKEISTTHWLSSQKIGWKSAEILAQLTGWNLSSIVEQKKGALFEEEKQFKSLPTKSSEKQLQPKISKSVIKEQLLKRKPDEMIERLYLLSKPYLFPEESPMRDMKQGEPKDLWISEMIDLSEKNFKTFWEPDAKPLFEAMKEISTTHWLSSQKIGWKSAEILAQLTEWDLSSIVEEQQRGFISLPEKKESYPIDNNSFISLSRPYQLPFFLK